jgi:hypothetical protein
MGFDWEVAKFLGKVPDAIQYLMRILVALGSMLTSIAMLACFGFGMVKLWAALRIAAGGLHVAPAMGRPELVEQTLIHSLLGGLEMFFLAPLPYLAFVTITKLIRTMHEEGRNLPPPQQIIARQDLEHALERVAIVKRLINGLMVAVVSTELIHRLIGEGIDGSDTSAKAFGIPAAVMIGLILALSINYKFSASHGRESN